MQIVQLMTPAEEERYERWVRQHPHGNLWQSLDRRAYLLARGMDVKIYAALDGEEIQASALVVIDRGRGGSTWEIPRGPLGTGDWGLVTGDLLKRIISDAKQDGCLAIFLSPSSSVPNSQSPVPSHRHVHAEATRIIDLTQSEEAILAQMHQKGRYNIKVAQKNGIVVRPSDDVGAFHSLLTATAARDAFTGHSRGHYEAFLKHIPGAFLLLAYSSLNEPVAGLMGVAWPSELPVAREKLPMGSVVTGNSSLATGIYYYGASSYAHRNLMAPYLLQWEAMTLCKGRGCVNYDLLGIAPEGAGADHPWAGISDFKGKFGGTVVTYPPEQMIVLQPMKWKILQMKRRFLG